MDTGVTRPMRLGLLWPRRTAMPRRGIACMSFCLSAFLMAALPLGTVWAAELWVTNMKSANVQVFDPTTLKLVATIPADKGAHNVTFSPDEQLAFIANVGANNVTIIDAQRKEG